MEYKILDKYADKASVVHRMDARVKIICALLYIMTLVSIPVTEAGYVSYFPYFLLAILTILAARLPVTYVLKRSLVVLPFIIIPAAAIPFMQNGVETFIAVFFKSWLSALTMATLVATTPSAEMLAGLCALGVPKVFTMTVSFMIRYLTVIGDELSGMKTARDARSFRGNRRWYIKTAGSIIGSLFIRSYSRAERIYSAMLARGYDGTMKAMNKSRMTPKDIVLAAVFLAAATIIRVS